jgi:2-oxoisovalerate dehydrogenase E1 component alpha subunit
MIIRDKVPVLIEAMSYRVGDHSTSDFSQAYRNEEEMKKWDDLLKKVKSPISRLENYMLAKGLISKDENTKLRESAKLSVREALKTANDL